MNSRQHRAAAQIDKLRRVRLQDHDRVGRADRDDLAVFNRKRLGILAEARQRNDRPAEKDEIGAVARSSACGRHRRYRGRPGGCREKLSARKPEPQAAE